MSYSPAVPENAEEEREKKEHEEDPGHCDWPYADHDESNVEVDNEGNVAGTCRRCDADFAS